MSAAPPKKFERRCGAAGKAAEPSQWESEGMENWMIVGFREEA